MIATRFRSVYWVGGVAVAALSCYLVSQRVAAERATLARTEAAIVSGKRDIRALQTEIGTRAGLNQIERWNAEVLSLSAPKASQFLSSEVQLAALVQPVTPAMAEPAVVQVAVAAPERSSVTAGVTQVSFTREAARPAATKPVDKFAAEPASAKRAVADKAPSRRTAEAKLAKSEAAPKHRTAETKLAKADATSKHRATEPKLAKADAAPKRRAEPKFAASETPTVPHVTRVSYVPAAKAGMRRLADDGDDAPRVRQAIYVRPGRDHQNVALLDDKLLGNIERIAANERQGGKRSR